MIRAGRAGSRREKEPECLAWRDVTLSGDTFLGDAFMETRLWRRVLRAITTGRGISAGVQLSHSPAMRCGARGAGACGRPGLVRAWWLAAVNGPSPESTSRTWAMRPGR